jgi:G6PDH family F420-dependent oxidoreductase
MRVGYFLSSEEHSPNELLQHAVMAQEAGFDGLWISDHYHPWTDRQGHSAFVWATIGALAQVTPGMHVTTAVTCPTMRIHPAVVAQAAATAAVLLDGNFTLGVGTGEALNEHIFGDAWPRAAERREMLEEAVEVIRMLWEEGTHSHQGRHYTVDNARVYDLPGRPPEILVSGFGEHSIDLAAQIGDGFATIEPDGEAVSRFRAQAQRGRRVAGSVKVCWHEDEERARELAHALWATDALPGELAQILPTPAHFEQAIELVDTDTVAAQITCGPDIEKHVQTLRAYEEAGFDELYVQQIGADPSAFFAAYRESVLPLFSRERELTRPLG